MFQHTDSTGWTITPYCTATAKHPDFDLIDLGTYSSGNSFKEVGYTYSSGNSFKEAGYTYSSGNSFKEAG